jgi:hypothetical protein
LGIAASATAAGGKKQNSGGNGGKTQGGQAALMGMKGIHVRISVAVEAQPGIRQR